MKIQMIKHGVTHQVDAEQKDILLSAGWQLADTQVKAIEEIIRLKPAVKNKATVKALDEANNLETQGDE